MMKFQVERIALFSDAVFAIAITLMMIEVHPPHITHDMTFGQVLGALAGMSGTFIATLLSFILIGLNWMKHHQLMKYMAGYNERLLWINMMYLFSIAIIPFSTAFVFENSHNTTPVPMVFYNLNLLVSSLLCYRLFTYVLNPANGLAVEPVDREAQFMKTEILLSMVVYVLVIVLACINLTWAPFGYAAFALQSLVERKKKAALAV